MLKAKKILSVSNITSNKINENFPKFKNKVSLISCGTDFNYLHNDTSKKGKWKYNFPKKRYFLYVGSIEPRKNLISLLDSFQKFSDHSTRRCVHKYE